MTWSSAQRVVSTPARVDRQPATCRQRAEGSSDRPIRAAPNPGHDTQTHIDPPAEGAPPTCDTPPRSRGSLGRVAIRLVERSSVLDGGSYYARSVSYRVLASPSELPPSSSRSAFIPGDCVNSGQGPSRDPLRVAIGTVAAGLSAVQAGLRMRLSISPRMARHAA